MLDPSDLMDIQEAVRYSQLTRQRLYQLKETVGIQFKGNWYFSKRKLDEYLAGERKPGPRPKEDGAVMTPVSAA
jgi:hypothetical protein